MHCIVIGAGLAGLVAASTVAERGHRVTVLEARDRVGGRTWSHRLPNGVIVERGGEFISEAHGALREPAGRLALPLTAQGCAFDRRETLDGETPRADTVLRAGAEVGRLVRRRLDAGAADFSLAEAFASAPDTVAHRAAFRRAATSVSLAPERVSARWFAGHGAGTGQGYGAAVRVAGGNQRVADELARGLGGAVRTGAPVTAVAYDDAGAEVHCAGGAVVAGDAVVVAVPLPLVSGLDIVPGLPAEAGAALRVIGFGDAAKLHAGIRPPAGVRSVTSSESLWWSWNRFAEGATGPEPALNAFAGGDAALRALAVAGGPQAWARALSRLRPDAVLATDPLLTWWGGDPWARGSYSAPLVGWTPSATEPLRRRFGRLVFAGEHTDDAYPSTMNGAVRSGIRAGRAVLTLKESHGTPR